MGVAMRMAPAMLGAAMMMTVGLGHAAEEEAAPTATFTVEQQTLDLGEITAGQAAVAVFRFHNTGPTDVHIVRAKPS